MIFLHETHEIIGGKTAEFEAARAASTGGRSIEADGTARLLWFWHHTHGTGPSYQAVSITAVRDWAAWGEIVEAMRGAGVAALVGGVLDAAPRGGEQAAAADRVVAAAGGRPRRAAGSAGRRAGRSTCTTPGWPYVGKLDAYVDALGSVFYPGHRAPTR